MAKKLLLKIRPKKDISAPIRRISIETNLLSGDGIARDLTIGKDKITTESQITKTSTINNSVISTMLLALVKSTVGVAAVASIGKLFRGIFAPILPILRGIARFLSRFSLTMRAGRWALGIGSAIRGLLSRILRAIWRGLGSAARWFMRTRFGRLIQNIIRFPGRVVVGLKEIGRVAMNAFYRTRVGQNFLLIKAVIDTVRRGIVNSLTRSGSALYNFAIHSIYNRTREAIALAYANIKYAFYHIGVAIKIATVYIARAAAQRLMSIGAISWIATRSSILYNTAVRGLRLGGVGLGLWWKGAIEFGRSAKNSFSRSLIGRGLKTAGKFIAPVLTEAVFFAINTYSFRQELINAGFSKKESTRVAMESSGVAAIHTIVATVGMGIAVGAAIGGPPGAAIGAVIAVVGAIYGIAQGGSYKDKWINEQIASGRLLPSQFDSGSLNNAISAIEGQVARDIYRGQQSGMYVQSLSNMDLDDIAGTIKPYQFKHLFQQPLEGTIGMSYSVDMENSENAVLSSDDNNSNSYESTDREDADVNDELAMMGYKNPSTSIIKYFQNRGTLPYAEHKRRIEGKIQVYKAMEEEYRATEKRLIAERNAAVERQERERRESENISSSSGSKYVNTPKPNVGLSFKLVNGNVRLRSVFERPIPTFR